MVTLLPDNFVLNEPPTILPPVIVAVDVILPVNSPPLAYTFPRNNASPVLAFNSNVAFPLLYAYSQSLDIYTPEYLGGNVNDLRF